MYGFFIILDTSCIWIFFKKIKLGLGANFESKFWVSFLCVLEFNGFL